MRRIGNEPIPTHQAGGPGCRALIGIVPRCPGRRCGPSAPHCGMPSLELVDRPPRSSRIRLSAVDTTRVSTAAISEPIPVRIRTRRAVALRCEFICVLLLIICLKRAGENQNPSLRMWRPVRWPLGVTAFAIHAPAPRTPRIAWKAFASSSLSLVASAARQAESRGVPPRQRRRAARGASGRPEAPAVGLRSARPARQRPRLSAIRARVNGISRPAPPARPFGKKQHCEPERFLLVRRESPARSYLATASAVAVG
jgi:hypothetical protein